jgi:HEAT repeat protein
MFSTKSPTMSLSAALRVAGYAALLLSVVSLGVGCKRKITAPPPEPVTPEQLKELIARVSGPKKNIGFIKDVRVQAANRLKDLGPQAKEAIPALEKLAKDKDPEVKKVAEEALAKIKGS